MGERDLRRAAVEGTAWSAAAGWVEQLLRFGVLITLAHLIPASAFGLFALASSMVGILLIVAAQGMTTALVQAPKLERDHLDTAFWSGVAAAGAALGVILLAARGAGLLLGQPELAAVLAVLALKLPLTLAGNVPLALLRRRLDFRSLAVARMTAQALAAVTALAMAFRGIGVWSLVARSLVEPAVLGAVVWVLARWRPRAVWRRRSYRELIGMGAGITGVQLLRISRLRLAELLIGLVLGTRILGFFSVARRLVESLAALLRRPVGDVAWAMLARAQSDPQRLRNTVVERLGLLSVLNLPALAAVVALAAPFVELAMGQDWVAMAPILQALAVASAFEVVEGLTLSAVTAIGAIVLRVKLEAVVTVITLGALTTAVGSGGVAAAWAFTAGMGIATVLTQVPALRRLPVGFADVARAMAPGAATALAVAAILAGITALLPPGAGPLTRLAAPGLPAGLVLLLALRHLAPRLWRQVGSLGG
ncbi:MAG TPA: hypothetical protein ENK19_07350 [Acidobacteria bacterium]|nr:hypothetical protein [Acidobacteriota bacterium]